MTRQKALPITSLLLALLFAVTGAFAQREQTYPQSGSQEMQQEMSITGQLKSVDPDAKTIVVTSSDGTDMEFRYDEQTQITGAQDSIEGLASSSGSEVTVFYREDDQQQKWATRIDAQSATGPGTTEETPQDPGTTPDNPTDPNRPQDDPGQLPDPQQP